jgi:ketosteroid isomerase-like protein
MAKFMRTFSCSEDSWMQVSSRVYAAVGNRINRRFFSKYRPLGPGSVMRVVLVVLFVSSACAPGEQAGRGGDALALGAEQISTLRDQWEAASNANDLEAMKSFYAADAFIAPPGALPVAGAAGVGMWIDSRPEDYSFELEMESLETVVTGDWAFDRGTYSLHTVPRDPATPPTQSGSYLRIWRKEGESWRIARDIWNRMPGVELGPGVDFLPK